MIQTKERKLKKYKMIFDKKRVKRIWLLFGYVILSCIFIYFLKPTYLLSIFIVLVPPSMANFLWLKNSRKKIFIFSLTATILFAFAVELSSRLADSWDVQSVLPRILGIIPIENMIFAFLNFFWVLSFYEYFINKDSHRKISKKFKYLVMLFSIFSLIVFSLYFCDEKLIAINYFTMAVITLIIPSIIIFSLNPQLLKKTIIPMIFFAFTFFIYEIVSLINKNWWWPGKYLFSLNLLGNVFPLDDIVIWYFLSTIALIGGYEFFADDFK